MRLERRQAHHLSHLDPASFVECLAAVESAFGETWLESAGEHQIQKLWMRPDPGATNELINLGYVLRETEKRYPGLGTKIAAKIRREDLNNQRGLLFELLVIGSLHAKNGTVGPTPKNAPGFDVCISFHDGSELLLSLKSWGTSQHERIFRKKAASFEQFVKDTAEKTECHSVTVRAMTAHYPEETDWNQLRSAFREALDGQPLLPITKRIGDLWEMAIQPIWSPNGPVTRKRLSHEVLILSPYHRNEIRNFRYKLEEAVQNAEKHAVISLNRMHGVVVRVPANLSWTDANEAAQSCLDRGGPGAVGLILLVQAAVVTDNANRSSQYVFTKLHASKRFLGWAIPQRSFGLRLELATTGPEPSRNVAMTDGEEQRELLNTYSYHSGDLYVRFQSGEATVSRLAPGLRQHAIMPLDDQEIEISGIFPPNDDMVLFD